MGDTIDPVCLSAKGIISPVGGSDFVPLSNFEGVPMSQCSHVAFPLGEHRLSGINPLLNSQWDVLSLLLYAHLILRGRPRICLTLTPLLSRVYPPVIQCKPGLHSSMPVLSSDSQPIYYQGVTPDSMHVGQEQHYDRPVQSVDLQLQIIPIQIPLFRLLIHSLSPVVTTVTVGIHQTH